ncbi:MAG: spermidine/putrescine ABC transporter substrate-binding protein [Pyrobaculum sp.]
MWTRRKLLVAAGAATALSVFGFLLSREFLAGPKPAGGLAVYNYSYYIDKGLLPEFEKEYGVKVVYQEFESGEEAYAALLRGGGGYDLIIVPDMYVKEAVERGLVRRIDHGKLSNLNNIDPEFFQNPNDPGLQHAIPYAYGTTGVAANYHAMRVDARIEGWGDLFNFELLEKMRGRVAMLEEFSEPVMAAKYALGIDPDDWSEAAVRKVTDLLLRQREYIRGYLGVSIIVPALAAGELWVSQIWSGDALTAREEFTKNVGEKYAGEFVYLLPKPMSHRWVDMAVIPRDVKNVEAAYAFIDFLLRPENSARITLASYFPTPLKRQLLERYLPQEVLQDPAVFPPEGAKLIYLNYTREMIDAVERIRAAIRG